MLEAERDADRRPPAARTMRSSRPSARRSTRTDRSCRSKSCPAAGSGASAPEMLPSPNGFNGMHCATSAASVATENGIVSSYANAAAGSISERQTIAPAALRAESIARPKRCKFEVAEHERVFAELAVVGGDFVAPVFGDLAADAEHDARRFARCIFLATAEVGQILEQRELSSRGERSQPRRGARGVDFRAIGIGEERIVEARGAHADRPSCRLGRTPGCPSAWNPCACTSLR